MAAKRDAKAAAKREYIRRRAKGEKVNMSEFAQKMGVNYGTLRRWKEKEGWDSEATPKRGAPKGNKNAAGNSGGAPLRNRNAEKDGAYSAVFMDELTEKEQAITDMTPESNRENLRHELKILRIRENRTLEKIRQYEKEDAETLHLNSLMDMREPDGETGEDGAAQTMGMYSSDTAFARIEKLDEALYRIQGRIIAVLNALQGIEDGERKEDLERQRLEIMRMRASGTFIIDGEDGAADDAIHG